MEKNQTVPVSDEDFAIAMFALFGPYLGNGYCPE